MGNLGEALKQAGISPALTELRVALSKFINQGGTTAQIRAEADAIDRMSGMGQTVRAENSQVCTAQTRQQVEGGGASATMPKGHAIVAPSPSSDRGGDGHAKVVSTGHRSSAGPVREPTQQQREAVAAARNVTAITIMDTLKIDGRSIGNWTVGEARKAGQLKTREGYILIEAARVVANAKGNELLRHVVKPKELQKIIQKAAEVADAI